MLGGPDTIYAVPCVMERKTVLWRRNTVIRVCEEAHYRNSHEAVSLGLECRTVLWVRPQERVNKEGEVPCLNW